MAAGLPAVVTNVGGSQDLVEPGINGIVVEPGDTGAMADALRELARSSRLRIRFGRENLKKSGHYSWERIAGRYLECV